MRRTRTWSLPRGPVAALAAGAVAVAGLAAPAVATTHPAGPPTVPASTARSAAPTAADPVVEIRETVSDTGFVHPGVGLTADHLENARAQVRAGVEPWASYYDAMSDTRYAARDYVAENAGPSDDEPKDDAFDRTFMRSRAHRDSIGAMTQALMYVMTGDEVYRANALHVLRTWSSLDPDKYAYFPDAHIHTGVPLYQMLVAAEIIRSTVPAHDELDGYDLRWTDRDQRRIEDNLVRPVLDTFLYSQNRLWNQHLYGVIGMVSAAIFLDDADLYAERVEWFTVNSTYTSEHTINGGDVNGALLSLFREIDADDPLNPYGRDFVQHLEMGRDQAHAEGDVALFTALARIVHNQGTRLDPQDGTVSTAPDAVTPYEFADHRILDGADAFAAFMMGEEVPWIDVSGGLGKLAQGYRGRLRDGLSELYYQYTYEAGVDVEKEAPHLAELHAHRDGPLYYYGPHVENFWGERGSDFTGAEYWVAFPPELAEQGVEVPPLADGPEKPLARYGHPLGTGAVQVTEGGESFVRLKARRDDAVVGVRRMVWSDTSTRSLVGIRVRTEHPATLQAAATSYDEPFAEIAVPDTDGEWRYVWLDLDASKTLGSRVGHHILVLRLVGGTSPVDVAGVLSQANDILEPPEFSDAPRLDLVAVAGEELVRDLGVTHPDGRPALSIQDGPKGARLDGGTLRWTPQEAGERGMLVVASDAGGGGAGPTPSVTALPVTVTVAADRPGAVAATLAGVAAPTTYTTASWRQVARARDAARDAAATADDAGFAAALEALRLAVAGLEELDPRLPDGTLDFSRIVTSPLSATVLAALVDGDNQTTWGDQRVPSIVLDLGPAYRVRADAFGFLARDTFANRAEGTNVYGSTDGEEWTLLTEHPNVGSDAEIERVAVRAEARDDRFRYLKLQVDEPGIPTDPNYPGIWTLADFRIDGERSEATLAELLALARGEDHAKSSRASVVLFEREVAAIASAAEDPDADRAALTRRLLDAWGLLEAPTLETVDVPWEWVMASGPSWDGESDAVANGWAMFDGDPSTFTDTATSSGWVSVVPDDGSSLRVAAVRFVPRHGYVSRAEGVQVQTSADGGGSWTTVASISGATDGWNRIDLESPVRADAVRLLAESGNTNLAEVELVSSTVDRSALRLYLAETAELSRSDWTPVSWADLVEARTQAEAVLADTAAGQADVDAATDRLAAAVSGLEPAAG